MMVRATLPFIGRILRRGAVATASLVVAATGFAALMICAFVTTPMYDPDCADFECRPSGSDLLSTAVVVERDRSELPPWAWTSEPSPAFGLVCDGAWKAACEPPMWCDGTLSSRNFLDLTGDDDPRAELTITTTEGMDLDSRNECTATLKFSKTTQFRLQHESTGVVVFGRSAETLATWQYDLDCNLRASQHFPDVFRHGSVALQQLPMRPRQHVLRRGVYFSTDGECGEMCNMQVWEAPFDARHSEHWLVSPHRIAIDENDEFIAWSYYNDEEWFLRVLDRETHDIVLDDRGSDAAITHFRLVGGLLALEVLENGTAMHNKPAERRVYELSTPAPSTHSVSASP